VISKNNTGTVFFRHAVLLLLLLLLPQLLLNVLGMNRHHYALFVRNCHLVLLLRQEPFDTPLAGELRPAEWRWDIPQVCDNRWHHYAVSVHSVQVGGLFAILCCDGFA